MGSDDVEQTPAEVLYQGSDVFMSLKKNGILNYNL